MTRTVEIVQEAIGDVEVISADDWTVEIEEQDGSLTAYVVRASETRTLTVADADVQNLAL